ncbi:methylamine utilization protein MauE [Pseudomaricurvus alkylphenolicus]|uniref:MauE/DoxX family redox-associated membrane protein n=1 Tax=Pseudomaricurvus alkylphenolicus TaxID=1306991 RepID=UPI00142137CA|nr:MauE/DoxX family redox-associated membrane protein [Pseudomaricurvus alkylphenolicus]NIB44709.1 methylamine utilization protein MauE [Pseudomaricurvus alkylphenolicus]
MLFIDPVFEWIVCLALALLMATAAWQKLRHPKMFRGVLEQYRILPEPVPRAASIIIPLGELASALALMFPDTRDLGSVSTAALLTSYAFAMAVNLVRGRRYLDCGCHLGSHRQRISGFLVLRNGLLVLLTLSLLLPTTPRVVEWFDMGIVCYGLGLTTLLYHICNTLDANRHRLSALS